MKKVMIVTAIAASLAAPAATAAGDTFFGSLGDVVMKGRNALRETIPTEVSALEADGGNFRYYEWEAPQNPNVVCWIAAGTQKGAGGCYPKAQVSNQN